MSRGWIVLLTAVSILAAVLVAGVFIRRWWRRYRRRSIRVMGEDALKHVYDCVACNREASVLSVANKLRIRAERAKALLEILYGQGLLHMEAGSLQLTPSGERYALHIIRAHRLWEHYLAEETGFQESEWHEIAEKREHFLPPDEAHALSAKLGHPTHDPHGHPIPTHQGEMVAIRGDPLLSFPPQVLARVVRLEDQPDCVYAQLVEDGLYPGMVVQVLEANREGVRFLADGIEHWLPPIPAANVCVIAKEEPVEAAILGVPLSALSPGGKGEVMGLSPRLRGAERRRIMDLGVLPGTEIGAEMIGPSGDPTAYRIRGALIALRKEQADRIRIRILDHKQSEQKPRKKVTSSSVGS